MLVISGTKLTPLSMAGTGTSMLRVYKNPSWWASSFQSGNYFWNLASEEKDALSQKGTAIFISKSIAQFEKDIRQHYASQNDCVRTNFDWIWSLNGLILEIGVRNVDVAGDFNAHVGISNSMPSDIELIDPNLFHDKCDFNAHNLKNLLRLHRFQLKNSFVKSKTLRTTSKSGDRVSQIDHALFSPLGTFSCLHMSAMWTGSSTDHKLIRCSLKVKGQSLPPLPVISEPSLVSRIEKLSEDAYQMQVVANLHNYPRNKK